MVHSSRLVLLFSLSVLEYLSLPLFGELLLIPQNPARVTPLDSLCPPQAVIGFLPD